MFTTVNPASGERLESFSELSDEQVDGRLAIAAAAFRGEVGRASLSERSQRLTSVATVLRSRREELAQLATTEMGKPIRDARAEIEKSADAFDYYARIVHEQMVDSLRDGAIVRYEALGPLLAIMPWNFPFWQVFRVLAPAIAVGNPMLLKHAENVLGSAAAIEAVVEAAGLPKGTLQTLTVAVPRIEAVLADARVQCVTITGSVRAGRSVAEVAGRYGKKVVLELGGIDPLLVLEDADVGKAVEVAARSRLFNSGQACIASKRFIVHRSVHEEFVAGVQAAFEAAVVGDPMEESTTVGPMARADLREALADQVRRTIAEGVRVVVGGAMPESPGFYFPPTLLADVQPHHTAAVEETFGPVGSVLKVDSVDAAVQLANATPYGLGATVCTEDRVLALDVAARLEVGVVAVNSIVASRPDLPFGGVKASGYGRELGTEALREFTNIKTVLTPGW